MMSWLVQGLVVSAIASVAGYLFGWWRARRKVPPIKITAERVTQFEHVQPRALIATFSGYPNHMRMDAEAFQRALREGDLAALPLDENTPSIGHTVKLLESYPSLEQVILIATHSAQTSSFLSIPLLDAWRRQNHLSCTIEQRAVDLDVDNQVTLATHREVRAALERLQKEGGLSAREILVDVTGGPRSMTVGALLACLGPDQNASLVGVRYGADGRFVKGSAFPMVIGFEPDWRALQR